VLSALLAALVLSERLSWVAWGGILLAFCGAGLIAGGEPGGLSAGRGALFCLGAALCQAFYFVIVKPLVARYGTFPVVCLVFWSGAACLLPYAGGLARELPRAAPADTVAVVGLGLGPAAVGYALWGYALARMPVAKTASFLYFVPVVATAIGWV